MQSPYKPGSPYDEPPVLILCGQQFPCGQCCSHFPALPAQRRIGPLCPESRTHQILSHPRKKVIGVANIITSESSWDIHTIWAGLTITAAGTRYLHLLIHGTSDLAKQLLI